MRAGSIATLTAALLSAPGILLAVPAEAASQPVVSSVSPGSGTIGTTVTITGSGFDTGCSSGQTGVVYFGGVAASNATVSDSMITAVAPTHHAGPANVQVADCPGDLSPITSADVFNYASPVVSSVSPGSGTIGTTVTISGSGFDTGCSSGQTGVVYFGGVAATNATVSDTAITAVAPTHHAGPANVEVADCLGDLSPITSADVFNYPSPVVSSVSPGSGTIGTTVTITGSGFDYACSGAQTGQVYFGGVPATNATVRDNTITAVAPTHHAGAANVEVADCLGDLSPITPADVFNYPLPVVSSVSPGSGTSGTTVTITGSGFDYGCSGGQMGQVYFGGVAATNATVTAATATVVAPAHGTWPVNVLVADCLGDLSRPSPAARYTFLSPGPRFFGLHVYGTESREATVIARLLKPGVLTVRVMRVIADRRLVFAGLVTLGQRPRGRSLIHWDFRIHHRLLGPGRYELTLHTSRGGVLSAPAAPGARTLLILTGHRVRLAR